MASHEIVVIHAPGIPPQHDAHQIGLLLRRSDKPDLRCLLVATCQNSK